MSKIKASFHNHSFHSDGLHSPWVIVMAAKFLGIKALSITDHNEISGSLKALPMAEKAGLIFFPGIECMFLVKARFYEVIAYFYDEKSAREFFNEYRYGNGFVPHFKSVNVVVEMIRRHSGAVVAPHPFGRKGVFRRMRNSGLKVDGIEVLNGFTGEKRNIKAKKHNRAEDFLSLGASDMHFFLNDMGNYYTQLESEKEITKNAIWENLLGNKKTIDFKAIGCQNSALKMAFQEALCGVGYALNYPRLYLAYRIGKNLYNQTKDESVLADYS